MLLSKYIEGLQKVLNEHGDLECYYAIDDEGNGYQKVIYNGTVFYTEYPEYRLDIACPEDEIEECGLENPVKICIVN